MALKSNGECYVWGLNPGFDLVTDPNDMPADENTPLLVATNVKDIMAGETFSYIVKNDNTLWAAGRSSFFPFWFYLA